MNDEITYKIINESIGSLVKEIVIKHYNSFEKINTYEIRIIIDLSIVYIELKNNLNIIVDRLVDKFKIIDKDKTFKFLVNHIYSDNIKQKILLINKIILFNPNLKTSEDILNNHITYLLKEIIKIIFDDEVMDFIKYYSDSTLIYIYYIKNIFRNWKIIIVVIFLLVVIFYSIKKLSKCNNLT